MSIWLKHHRAVPRRLLPMLITTGAVLAAFHWPPMYRSTGTILIEQQEMSEDFVRPSRQQLCR